MSEKDKKEQATPGKPEETRRDETPEESRGRRRSRAGDVHRHKGADAADGGSWPRCWRTPMTSICVWRRSTTTTASGPPEKEQSYGDAKVDTIKPFLAVLDNLERGVQPVRGGRRTSAGSGADLQAVQRGTGASWASPRYRRWVEPFDPEKHNAVMHTEDDTAGRTPWWRYSRRATYSATRFCGSPW